MTRTDNFSGKKLNTLHSWIGSFHSSKLSHHCNHPFYGVQITRLDESLLDSLCVRQFGVNISNKLYKKYEVIQNHCPTCLQCIYRSMTPWARVLCTEESSALAYTTVWQWINRHANEFLTLSLEAFVQMNPQTNLNLQKNINTSNGGKKIQGASTCAL